MNERADLIDFSVESLRSRVVRGLGWTTASLIGLQLSRFVFGILIARLLTPREFGLAAMVLVFSALVLLVSDLGFGVALVQRKEVDEKDLSTVFWTSLMIGAILSCVGIAVSGPVASFYGEPDVQPLLTVLSLSFVVMALGRTHASLLHRRMEFRAMALRVIAATVVGGVVGVLLAAAGYGPWALVGQHMTNTVVSTASLWLFASWYPRPSFSIRRLINLAGFALRYVSSRAADSLNTSIDRVIIGRFVGAAGTGLYSVSYGLILVPIASLVTAIADTLLPAFSRLQEDNRRLGGAWLRVTGLMAAGSFPAVATIVVIAPELVGLLLGSQWSDATPIVQILAIAGAAQLTSALGATVLTSVGRTKELLRFSLTELGVVLLAIAVGVQFGLLYVAAAYTAAILCTRLFLVRLAADAVSLSLRAFLVNLRGVAEATAVAIVVAALTRASLIQAGFPAPATMAAVILLASLVYLQLLRWRSEQVVSELRTIWSESLGTPAPRPLANR